MNAEEQQGLRSLKLITFAFAASNLIYILIAWFVRAEAQAQAQDPQLLNLLSTILPAVGAVLIGVGLVIPGLMAGRMVKDSGFGGYRQVLLIQFALYQNLGIFGLVIAFLGGDMMILLACCLASTFFILKDSPSRGRFAAWQARFSS